MKQWLLAEVLPTSNVPGFSASVTFMRAWLSFTDHSWLDRAQSPDCDWQPLQVALLLMMLTLHM
jgi:hypothetical protein